MIKLINFYEIKKELTPEQIIEIVCFLGADNYQERGNQIIFPTICHNPTDQEKSMKLYYYKESSLFRCYTECNESFDIFDLWQKVSELNDEKISIFEIVDKISRKFNLDVDEFEKALKYSQPLSAKIIGSPVFEFTSIRKEILNFFSDREVKMWIMEGISKEALKKYSIRFYEFRNKIIIPHFDVFENLIGIRVRNIEPEDVSQGKYMPAVLENKMYSHPLSFNLYGLSVSKENIKRSKVAYVFEGEKSCLKAESIYTDENMSVATCGSNLNKFQVMLLKKHCGVDEIVLCFDRQFETDEEYEKYFNKLYSICEKYNSYCKMSFVFDDKKLLKYKNSPIDQGREIFEKLLEERRYVRSY